MNIRKEKFIEKVKNNSYILLLLLFLFYIAGIITGLVTGYISAVST